MEHNETSLKIFYDYLSVTRTLSMSKRFAHFFALCLECRCYKIFMFLSGVFQVMVSCNNK